MGLFARTVTVMVTALLSHFAMAFEPFVVRDIRLVGVQRIEPGTVFGYLPVTVGSRLDDASAAAAVRALFATGFFKDVRLEVEGDVLIVHLEERPAVASVDISGAREIDAETLKRALRDLGLAESRIYDRAVLERAEQEIKRQYLARSKYGVRITSTVTPLERNRVAVTMAIDEGGDARIAQIRIVGNRVFSERTLIDQMHLTTPTWLSWYTKTDQYSREKLAGDLEALRSYYLNRGYLEMTIDSTQVSIAPDREGVYITVNITEGDRYTVSDISFRGETLGREEDFRRMLTLKPGDVFSGERLSESTKRISDALGAIGYAFANVNAIPTLDRDKRQVSYTISIDPGRRAYVRRINIFGNTRTRDEVIRREMRQFEGAWFDAERIRLSRERIDRLGYFQAVAIDTQPVPDTIDQVDINVTVSERRTGNFTVGIGFSSTEKLILSGSISQPNFLGTGNQLSAEINTSRVQKVISLQATDPYFTPDGISRSIDVYRRNFDASYVNLGDYRITSSGVGLRFGVPYTEYDRVFFGAAWEHTGIRLGNNPPRRYVDYVNTFGTSVSSFLGTLGWLRDSRDSAFVPTRGRLQAANLEFTLPGGDVRYVRGGYNHQWFYPINKDLTIALNGEIAHGRGFGGQPLPLFKNYYAGGIGSVRGFEPNSLGPRDPVDNLPLGGQTKLVGAIELLFPIPGTGNDRSIRGFTFFDVGNVYQRTSIDLSDLRYSVGFGLSWLSPIGPLKLTFGTPLRREPGDRTQRFQFQIGTGF
ncbi:MAG TPA: outer membrane protein assembly factor BamA [Burkholderiaceae bacterium]|nr:outer membrane protein assembly factor BamA [Burkholderiaceae bacterium]